MADKTPKPIRPDAPAQQRQGGSVADFVAKVDALSRERREAGTAAGKGRLLFALDATMSRQPTWDLACQLQAEMFRAVSGIGALKVQLLYFRGFGECRASKWVDDANGLARLMTGLECRGGHTQISKVLAHARAEHARDKINAVIYVGDAMEENVDALAQKAGELGLLGCPMFLFQEGYDQTAERAFREFARLTKGAYARFDSSAPQELSELLRAVAAYATGGLKALRLQRGSSAEKLLAQLR